MSLSIPVPINLPRNIYQCLTDITRKASDGTVPSNFNAQITVVSADIKVSTIGKGLVLPDTNGTSHTCRLEALYDVPTGNWVLVLTPLA